MLLHDHLEDAVADVHADLPTLASTSRRRGLTLRRRRRALATVGTLAAATVLAVGVHTALPVTAPEVADDWASEQPVAPFSGRTSPLTSRTVAAALATTVAEVSDGTISGVQGDHGDGEALAALRLQPAGQPGPAGLVMINLQPLSMAVGGPPYGCVETGLLDCTAWQPSPGVYARSYRDDDSDMGAGAQRLAVEVIDPARRLRLVVGASNTNPYADGALADAPALTTAQLTEVATRPWWSRTRLPVEFVAAGDRLEDFADAGD